MKSTTKERRTTHATEFAWTPERVKKLRGRRTQQMFGKLIGVPKNTVWRWEAGYAQPDAKRSLKLHRLAKTEKFQRDWKPVGSVTLLGDLEEGSRLLARLFGFSPFRMALKKD